jgi:hypothetical protein
LTQQVLNAQRSLPSAQNQVYLVWISFQTTRLQLYRDLELLPLDQRGVWIDELATVNADATNPGIESASGVKERGSGTEAGPRAVTPAAQAVQAAKP